MPQFGRIPDEKFARWQAEMIISPIATTAPKNVERRDIALWSWAGPRPTPLNQGNVGSCVGCGWAEAIRHYIGTNRGIRPEQRVCAEGVYGLSRVEIGGGRLGRQDGSLGSWAARAVKEYGVVLYEQYGSHDLRSGYTEQRAKDWGYRGMPDDLEPTARRYPVTDIIHTKTGDQVVDILCEGGTVPVASMQGFRMERNNDGTGICEAEGEWAHQMYFVGYLTLRRGNTPVAVCCNSWGDYLRGGDKVELATGQDIVLPPGMFCVRMDTVHKMARQGDTFGILGATNHKPTDFTYLDYGGF